MSCDDCEIYAINGLYECSCCRSNVCNKCYVRDKYLLCNNCNEKFRNGKIRDQDMNYWLVKCESCGNMWDGNAQCNCWEYDFHLAFEFDYESESDCENMTDSED